MRRQATAQVFGSSCGKKGSFSGNELPGIAEYFGWRCEPKDHFLDRVNQYFAYFRVFVLYLRKQDRHAPSRIFADKDESRCSRAKTIPQVFQNEAVGDAPRFLFGD